MDGFRKYGELDVGRNVVAGLSGSTRLSSRARALTLQSANPIPMHMYISRYGMRK